MSYSADPQETIFQGTTTDGAVRDARVDATGSLQVTDALLYARMGEVLQELRTLNKMVARFTLQDLTLEDN